MQRVVVGIIWRDGQVLACQRRRDVRYPLKWEFPGGKIEPDETAEEALVRELREELSITAQVGKQFFQQEWVYPEGVLDPHRDGAFAVAYFLIHSYTGELVNTTFESIKWVSPTELQSMDILEGNRRAIDELVKHGKEFEAA
jgi:8-oxo-dGTP diphosphatase